MRRSVSGAIALIALALVVARTFSGVSAAAAQLPLDATHESGQSVTAAYEGWFKNADGTFTLLVGYFNRNTKETLDIPVGPDNHIDPGGPDRGQPTHFLPRRQWGVFTITVPADFGKSTLTWTIVAHGKATSIPLGLHRDYEVSPYKDEAQGNTPPVLTFENGVTAQGPPRGVALSMQATVSDPLTLTLRATDDAIVDPDRKAGDAPVTLFWSQFRGPGAVTFSEAKPKIAKEDGRAATTARFAAPGDYILRVQANDVSGEGGGGFQCCWTNALIRVEVRGAPATR